MTPEMWQRLKPIYDAALELPESECTQFVEQACGNDLELKRELLALLKASTEATWIGDKPIINFPDSFATNVSPFSIGEVVMKRFEIVRYLDTGGMGAVYEAMDRQGGRVALKTIRREIAGDPDTLARFRNEVQLAKKITGPNICRVHDLHVDTTSEKTPQPVFLTMEFLDGTTLADKIANDGPLRWKEARQITLQICEGLQTIHEAGIIHRDLKSGNVMLASRNGSTCAVVMDFGLAREFSRKESAALARSAETSAIAGTLDYMAPEQFASKELTPTTDVYALGIVLYELVTGRHPFEARNPIEAAVLRGEHPCLASSIQPGLPRRCDEVICKCLEYEPEDRFQSAEEVAKALKAGPANFAILRRERPWILKLVGALALIALVWGVDSWWQLRQYYHPSAEAKAWYDKGVAALREGSYLKARHLLWQAVNQDQNFVMAHARLAEAWADLDFDGDAQREMLIATAGERSLSPLDREYLDAIRAALTHNFPEAVSHYKKILNKLPASEKAVGHVDLGMAYEHNGDPTHALEEYKKAKQQDKESAAAYMHAGVLEVRSNNSSNANQDFSIAESIMTTEMNQEGLANLSYERGYAENVSGHLAQAEQSLLRSRDEAKRISDAQLEVRALNQLSSVATMQKHGKEAVSLAREAIGLAQDNHLDAWTAIGFARLAYGQIIEGAEHYREATASVGRALEIAQGQYPRAEALANMAKATLYDQQNNIREAIPLVKEALNYYNQNGYFEAAAKASLLLMRFEAKNGQYEQAEVSGNNMLALSMQSGIHSLQLLAEEAVGDLLFEMEHYPDALGHYQKASTLADIREDKAYQALNCADTLWRLGRYVESDAMLATATQALATSDVLLVKVESLLSQLKYQQAESLIEDAIDERSKLTPDSLERIQLLRALTKAYLGQKSWVLAHLTELPFEKTQDPGGEAETRMIAAEIYLVIGYLHEAADDASSAETYFASVDRKDSELKAAYLTAIAFKLQHDKDRYKNYSTKILDILSSLKKNWGPQTFDQYLSRPDLHLLMRELPFDNRPS